MASLEEKLTLYEEHLASLTEMSISNMGIIQGAVDLLHRHELGEIELTEEQRRTCLESAKNNADKHLKLVHESIRERQEFINRWHREA